MLGKRDWLKLHKSIYFKKGENVTANVEPENVALDVGLSKNLSLLPKIVSIDVTTYNQQILLSHKKTMIYNRQQLLNQAATIRARIPIMEEHSENITSMDDFCRGDNHQRTLEQMKILPPLSSQWRILLNNNIGPYDVLCGRDRTSHNNIGNLRFRAVIRQSLPEYMKCYTRPERSDMICKLTRELCEEGQYRFLKKTKKSSQLIVLDGKESREKIAHALRDAAAIQRKADRKMARNRMLLDCPEAKIETVVSSKSSTKRSRKNQSASIFPTLSQVCESRSRAVSDMEVSQASDDTAMDLEPMGYEDKLDSEEFLVICEEVLSISSSQTWDDSFDKCDGDFARLFGGSFHTI